MAPRLPCDQGFFRLPEQLLLSYEQHREESELGHVFRIANSLHDQLDAIVVLGPASAVQSVTAVTQACCDPFHNEMSRADRGSKPRLYFADLESDNDYAQSLVWRLERQGYGDVLAERRYGIIAIDDVHSRDRLLPLLRLFSNRLSHWNDQCADLPAPMTVVSPRPDDWGEGQFPFLSRRQTLQSNDVLEGYFGTLSPATLLPAAFLGLDVIQLLVGAAAINDNFVDKEWHENLVLRLSTYLDRPRHQLVGWSSSFDPMMRWWNQLLRTASGIDVSWNRSVESEELNRRASLSLPELHLAIASPRTDPIAVLCRDDVSTTMEGLRQHRWDSSFTAPTMTASNAVVERLNLILPCIETNPLGQLLQLAMTTAALIQAERIG
ncbi:hypothetical protein LOC67_21965 [Stieleria sp. JC731]|uniref:hypothetical protein n=1 Tax=Stieleria sp. JC731 TaxID=2894195 RepID=UPI001E5DAB2A|nr:hypothetical protein [Stieleria sp. JC731]MCC9603224.1 hypothetical protein [Stieleria sp. JC731]